MDGGKFRSTTTMANKQLGCENTVDNNNNNDDDDDDDTTNDIIRTSSKHLKILFQMYLSCTTISISICIVEILKFKFFR